MMGESAPIQRWVQLAGYALIVGAALMVLSPFLVPLAWAAILAFATWRPYERVRRGLGGRAWLAAALMTTLVVLLVVIPAGLLSLALAAEAGRTFADFRLSGLTLPAGFSAALGELPWVGPRLADPVRRAPADPFARPCSSAPSPRSSRSRPPARRSSTSPRASGSCSTAD